jgi:hypothetical protein
MDFLGLIKLAVMPYNPEQREYLSLSIPYETCVLHYGSVLWHVNSLVGKGL